MKLTLIALSLLSISAHARSIACKDPYRGIVALEATALPGTGLSGTPVNIRATIKGNGVRMVGVAAHETAEDREITITGTAYCQFIKDVELPTRCTVFQSKLAVPQVRITTAAGKAEYKFKVVTINLSTVTAVGSDSVEAVAQFYGQFNANTRHRVRLDGCTITP